MLCEPTCAMIGAQKSQSGLLTPEQVANMSYQYATAAALNIAVGGVLVTRTWNKLFARISLTTTLRTY
jgi:hypothetical protein